MTRMDAENDERARAEEAAYWYVRVSEGQMIDADRADFRRWLSANDRNVAAFDAAVAALNEVQAAEASPEMLPLRMSALASLQRAHRSRTARLSRASRMRWALAACVALMAVFLAVVLHQRPRTFGTGTGERRTVQLDDGSIISLDAKSEVSVRYTGERRGVRLVQGRAKFQVAHDALRPFSVVAADREIVATGTAFSVELVQRAIHVVLIEGRVVVVGRPKGSVQTQMTPPSAAAPQRLALAAGDELVAMVADDKTRIEPVDTARSLSWESGQLEFVDEPLASAVERMNRYAKHPMGVGDARAASLAITGVFRTGEIPAFIEGVTAAFPVRVENRDGELVFVSDPSISHDSSITN